MSQPDDTAAGRRLTLLRPRLYCHDIAGIDFAALAAQGIYYYCIDLDNTLAPRTGSQPLPHLVRALDNARRNGFIKDICLVSNIICGQKRRQRVASFAEAVNTAHYYAAVFWERKPSPIPFRAALRMMRCLPENTACIGDQLFTDIVGGNSLGLYTILVEPLGDDHWTTRLTGRRRRERRILASLGFTAPKV